MSTRGGVPWWQGLAPAEAEVVCRGDVHVIRWAEGEIHLASHPDLEAEEALVALGGEESGCQAIVRRWRAAAQDPRLVTIGRRPGEGPIGLPAEMAAATPAAMPVLTGLPAAARTQVERRFKARSDVVELFTLPGALIDRLVLTAMAACAERWDDDAFRDEHGLRLGAALAARAEPALRRFGARLGRGTPHVVVAPSRPGGGPFFSARLEPQQPLSLTAELPVGWLVDVWGRGISEPEGNLVLAVRDADPSGRELVVDLAEWEQAGRIIWELTGVAARLVRDDDGRWVVADRLGP